MSKTTRIALASALALATALPAAAQQYRPTEEYQRQQREYDAQRSQYDQQRSQYEDTAENYREARQDYRQARAEYEQRLADWDRARMAYDERHGYGAYARLYARPVWDETAWSRYPSSADRYGRSASDESRQARRDYRAARRDYERRLAEWERARSIYDRRYGYGSYSRLYARPVWDRSYWTRYEPPPYAGYYGRPASATVPCNSSNSSTVAGGLIGALAGAVLGSSIAGRGDRTEGAVLGGIAGAVVGGAVGSANDRYKCDSRGPYFSYDETVPYREGRRRYSSSYDTSYYTRQQCRLAAAPVDSYGRDVRYVRVCPDDQGRYRITG